MNLLNREQERAIKTIGRNEQIAANREIIERQVGDRSLLIGLANSGYVDFSSSIDDPSDSDCRHVYLTSEGRCYFSQRRRDTRRRWAPVLASAAIGVAGTLLGVIATLLLS